MSSPPGKSIPLGQDSSGGFEAESRRFLQGRLRLLCGFACLALAVMATAIVGSLTTSNPLGTVLADFLVSFPGRLLTASALAMGLFYLLLRRPGLGGGTLALLDALAHWILSALCVLPYVWSEGILESCIAGLVVMILSRAVVVPSTELRTAVLSTPALLVVAGIDGTLGDPTTQAVHLVLILWATAIAALASRINIGLRRRTWEAQQLGQYKLEEPIGAGSMGEVYRATHALMKRPSAIKFLRPEIAEESTIRRFEFEVQQSCRLSHPNTISIFDYGRSPDGVFYYAMELLRGATLKEVLARGGPLPPARVIHVLVGVCNSLIEAHGLGLVHRDIKTENIMLCDVGGEPDVVKVLDFGLARDLRSQDPALADQGRLIGTPETMPPEAVQGMEVGPAGDLYSLGVVGYALCSGERIFETTSAAEFLRAHVEEEPIPLTARSHGLPGDLVRALHRCLGKTPEERYPDARALRTALLECNDAGSWSHSDAAAWWSRHPEVE